MRPSDPIRTAPSAIGGSSIGNTHPAASRTDRISARGLLRGRRRSAARRRGAAATHDAVRSLAGAWSLRDGLPWAGSSSAHGAGVGRLRRDGGRGSSTHWARAIATQVEWRVNGTELSGLGTRDERLDVVKFLGAERRRFVPCAAIDVQRCESVGSGPGGGNRTPVVNLFHHGGPRRSGENAALGVALDLLGLVEP